MKRLGVIAGLLLLGVAVNVLVAWGAMLLPTQRGRDLSPTEIRGHMAVQPLVNWLRYNFIESSECHTVARTRIEFHDGGFSPVPTVAQGFAAGPTPFLFHESAGWPWRCLETWTDERALPTRVSSGLLVGKVVLPADIRAKAFALNSMFHAAVLGAMTILILRYRRWSRTRRRLCTLCGYDLRGAPHHRCPECGRLVGLRRAAGRVGRIGLYLGLGMVINALLAVFCVMIVVNQDTMFVHMESVRDSDTRLMRSRAPDNFEPAGSGGAIRTRWIGGTHLVVPNNSGADSDFHAAREYRSGLPLRSFMGLTWEPKSTVDLGQRSWGMARIPALQFEGGLAWVSRPLPIAPLWFGQIVNAAFYGGLLWLAIHGPGHLRRWKRRRRGLCLTCGYDLRSAMHKRCPECGHAPTVTLT